MRTPSTPLGGRKERTYLLERFSLRLFKAQGDKLTNNNATNKIKGIYN